MIQNARRQGTSARVPKPDDTGFLVAKAPKLGDAGFLVAKEPKTGYVSLMIQDFSSPEHLRQGTIA